MAKNRNFRKHKNTDGTFTYIITIDGEKMEVSEAVYNAYAEGGYKMENMDVNIKNNRVLQDSKGRAVRDEHGNAVILPEREISLDKLVDEDWDFASAETSPEDIVIKHIMTEELHRCLGLLNADERALINALFFAGMTEERYAEQIGVVQKTVNYRKYKVLEKLKKLFEKK